MKNSTLIAFASFLAILMFALPASAQLVTLTSTTTSAAQTASERVICLTSATGVSVPGVGTLGSSLYIGGTELERVQSVTTASASCFNVSRSTRPVGHASGETVYIGAPNNFKSMDLLGTCTLGAMEVRPWINTANGNIWDCVSSKYQIISGPAASAVGITALGPATANTTDIGSALLPFRKLYLGTAATNNMVITPAATSAARVITMADPGGAATLAYTNPTTQQTLTNTTLNGAGGIINSDTVKSTAEFVAVTGTTGTTLTNVTGMVVTVVPGTYRFYINVPGVTTANAGAKYAFKYTTAVAGSLEATSRAYTAAAVAVTHTTTATDQALLTDSAGGGAGPAVISTVIEGTMVVTTGGTIQFQAAQKSAHADETKVYVGASMTFTRIL